MRAPACRAGGTEALESGIGQRRAESFRSGRVRKFQLRHLVVSSMFLGSAA